MCQIQGVFSGSAPKSSKSWSESWFAFTFLVGILPSPTTLYILTSHSISQPNVVKIAKQQLQSDARLVIQWLLYSPISWQLLKYISNLFCDIYWACSGFELPWASDISDSWDIWFECWRTPWLQIIEGMDPASPQGPRATWSIYWFFFIPCKMKMAKPKQFADVTDNPSKVPITSQTDVFLTSLGRCGYVTNMLTSFFLREVK